MFVRGTAFCNSASPDEDPLSDPVDARRHGGCARRRCLYGGVAFSEHLLLFRVRSGSTLDLTTACAGSDAAVAEDIVPRFDRSL